MALDLLNRTKPAPGARLLSALALLLCCNTLPARAAVDFTREVRPLLAKHCFKCHGPDEAARKGKLRLDVRENAFVPAKSGEVAIIPGKAAESELVKRLFTTNEEDVMPPPASKLPLTEKERDILKQWVAEGAEYRPHWAFVKPVQSALPEVKDHAWPKNPIDNFVLARLEKEGLTPSAGADKYTLVRRLYLDLTGLLPTPEEADAFVNDASADAYEKLVDRLLASPRYGERWARRWMDLARYADTNGYEKDRPRSIWPWRDWVIKSLNADMPFDQFTIEQLAGDMLPNATRDQITATGMHRNTMLNEEGGIDPLEFRFYSMVDRVNVTGTTWLGLTMSCVQCHTHKYDPIQHSEFYKLMACMNNADEIKMDVPQTDLIEQRFKTQKQIDELEAALVDKFPAEFKADWLTPGSVAFSSEAGVDGEAQPDGSILISGKNPEKDTYTLTIETDAPRITHLMVEALPDSRIEKGGPGRTDHGNFVLTEVELKVTAKEGDQAARTIKIASGLADMTQDQFPVENAFDGKADTGWAPGMPAEKRSATRAVFTLAEPVTDARGSRLTVRLSQQFGKMHTMGRFRVSLGTELPDTRSIVERSRDHRDRKLAKWIEAEVGKVVAWTRLHPVEAKSEVPVLTIQDDDSVFASGDFTKNDTYTLKFQNLPAGVKSIRLEAMPDDRLPGRGPGIVYYEGSPGDFWLSNLKLSADGKAAKVKSASESFASDKHQASAAIDDDLQSGWGIDGGQGKTQNAVFQLAEPLGAVSELTLDLTFEKYFASGLGRFRVWVTTEDNARASSIPNDVADVLLKYRGDKVARPGKLLVDAPRDLEKVLRHFVTVAPELSAERKEIAKLRSDFPKFPTTLVMRERSSDHNRLTYRHHRGEFLQPKELVTADVPAFLPPLPEGAPKNRLSLAKWLVSGENPLTGRVMMNRHWEAFFGRALVRTMEDFGFQGETPSHPALLDWLAVEFVKQGWSQKKMHKLIVMSATYQQASDVSPKLLERDPQNILLSRGPRFRIEAELVRDTTLAASGLLSGKIGGPSVYPPQPAGVTTEGAYGQLSWKVSTGEDRYRRGLYTFAKRTAPFAMTSVFDGPSGEACLARRDRSNTPMQALTLLNDEVFLECARALGKMAAEKGDNEEARLNLIFRRCLTRPPTAQESARLLGFYRAQLARLSAGELKASELLGSGEGDKANELAAWTVVARVILNLDESISKS